MALDTSLFLLGIYADTVVAAVTTPLKTPIMVGTTTNTAPSNIAVKYTPPCGGATINGMWQSLSSRPDTPCTVAGTFSNLTVRLPAALTGAQTWAWTLVVNGVDSALTVTIDSSGLIQTDTTHTVSVSANDTICFKSAPTGTPTAQTNVQISCLFTATSGGTGPLFTTYASSTTGVAYGTPGTINSGTEAESSRRSIMPTAGTITALTIGCNTAPGVGATRTVTLMKNGVDVLTANIVDNATTGSSTGSVSFVAGDLIQLRRYAGAGTPAASLTFVGINWTPTTAGEVPLFSAGTGNFDSTTTLFQNLSGTAESTETTEANTFNLVPIALTITKFRCDAATAPGVGKSRTVTVRKNSANTSATVSVADVNTSATFSGSVAATVGDLLDWTEIPVGTPAASNPLGISAVVKVP